MIYGLLFLLQPDVIVISTGGPKVLDQRNVVVRDTCLPHVFEFAWTNSYPVGGRTQVSRVAVDNVEIEGAADVLQHVAAGRPIEYIGLANCGEARHPIYLRASIEFLPAPSASRGLPSQTLFRLVKVDDKWVIEF